MDSHIPCVESRRKIVGYINQVKILRIFGVSSATLFSLILLTSIFPIASHTDHVGAAPETSTTDITMVTGRSSANLDITPNSGAGTFATSTGNNTASFNVTTNSYTGYTLKILGSDTNGQLANAVYNTALSPIDSVIDGDTFAASSSNIYNNKWGIIPSKVNSQANTNYLPAPVNTGIASTTTEIFMNKTSCANGTSPCSSASDNYTIGIGARIDFTRPAGLYTKSFTLAAVGNPATYTINYSKGDVVDVIEGMPTNATTGSATDPNVTTISLDSATPTRANYDFAGWCLGTLSGTTANPGTTCNGTLITDRIFTLNQASDNEATLYATWTAKKFNVTIKTTEGISKVSLNGTECDKTTGCTISNLSYNNTYNLVATPAPGYTFSGWDPVSDGNIANTSNATTTYTVGTADTTITPTATINKYNITIKTATGISKVSLNGTECDKTSGCTVPNLTYGQSYELKATVASGYTFSSWNAGAYGSVAANTATTTYTVGVGDSIITPSASVNKYSLTITFAGVGVSSVAVKTGNCSGSTMGTATSSSPTVTGLAYNVIYYLCPSFNNNYEFRSWAQTSSIGTLSSTSAEQPTFTMGAGNGAVTITGMAARLWFQKATTADCGKTMYDKRGIDAYRNIPYTTAKIGNLCWMTRNLDLPGETTLTPADSNVSANYTLPVSSMYSTSFSDDDTAYVFNTENTSCDNNSPCYSYYSYKAATAGTNPSSGEVTSDICPKGWRLPTRSEYITLQNTYVTGPALTAAPFNGVYSDSYYDGSFGTGIEGSVGSYWSSTVRNSYSAYYLHFDNIYDKIFTDVDAVKREGLAVRCVKEDYMQDFTTTNANALAEGSGVTLRDKRDEQLYSVAKINGQVWMTKNLDLAGGKTLTPADSNVSANYTLPASSNSSTSFSNNNTAYVYNSNSTTCGDNSPCYSYYSYAAATAGTATAGTGTDMSYGEATSDICPKGWRLPTSAELTTLTRTYTTGATLTAAPFNGVYAGGGYNGSLSGGGSYGLYWSSDYSSSSLQPAALDFDPHTVYVRVQSNRQGVSIRCVFGSRYAISSVVNMQDITSTIVGNTPDGTTTALVDSRDHKTYTVAKINGKLWMTKNLDLAGGTTITKSDSNITANSYTLPASNNGSSSFSDDNTAYVYNSNSTTCGDNSPCYSYYSYAAATAGTGATLSSGAPTSDICPKGWKLPTTSDYDTVMLEYGGGLVPAFAGTYAGIYDGGVFYEGGEWGYYWSSQAAGSSSGAYYLVFSNSEVNIPGWHKKYGLGVRCVAK